MKKKILAIMGSPRPKMHTNTALDLILDNVDHKKYEINKFNLRELNISHCKGCESCGRTGDCILTDDMDMIYNEFDSSDIIILAAPIYFNSVNSLTKAMIDRCQKYWSQKYILGQNYKRDENRKGIYIGVGGAPFTLDQFSGAIPVMDYFFRAINADYHGNYFISNSDRIKIDEEINISSDLIKIGREIDIIGKFNIQK